MKNIIITLDGPAGSGKTSSAKIIAEHFNYLYIDTGAMYRAVALCWLRKSLEYNVDKVIQMLPDVNISLRPGRDGQRTFLNGEDVSEDIRTPEVTKFSSPISAIPQVREKLVKMQQEMGKNGGVVMDGRDIGTVVFPRAELKIFLNASIEVRAERRTKELISKGLTADIEQIKKDIAERDLRDSTRETSPLLKAKDAIEIDTGELTLSEQAEKIIKLAEAIIGK